MGFLIGALAGAVIALLYAPKPGDTTRIELRQRTDELMRRADELEKVARDLAAQAQVKGRELADEAKKQWESTAKRSGSGDSGPSSRP